MKIWAIKGSKGHKKVILMSAETDDNTYYLGIRKLRVMTETLGIIHLASYLENNGWQFEQAFTANELEIANYCQNAVVGISTQINNYENSLSLATLAKKHGCRLVIMGGPHATNVAEQIIQNQPAVDIVVRGQGEVILHKILEGVCTKRGVLEEKHLAFRLLPPRNRALWSNLWQAETTNLSGRKWSMISFTEGCPQAKNGNPCVFCSIKHAKEFSCRTINQMVDEMKQLQTLGIGALEIGDDDFPGVFNKKQLTKLLVAMNTAKINLKFFIHARAVSIIDLEHLEMLKQMGVEVIQVGLESGDATMKTLIGVDGATNKATLEQEDQLFAWCEITGVKVQATFVVGIPGETNHSMNNTFIRAESLVDKKILWSLMIDPLIPLPGSRAFEMLCARHPEFTHVDHIKTEQYINNWFSDFTSVNLNEFLEIRHTFFSKLNITIAGMLLKI